MKVHLEQELGDLQEVRGLPWDLRGDPWARPCDPGRPWVPPVTPRDQKHSHISTSLQRQKLSIAMTPLDCLMVYTLRTEPFLIGHRAEPGQTLGFRKGWAPMGEEPAHGCPRPSSPSFYSLNNRYVGGFSILLLDG